jgi:hypothetical protein
MTTRTFLLRLSSRKLKEYNRNRAIALGLNHDAHLPTEAVEPEVEVKVDAKAKPEETNVGIDATSLSRKRPRLYHESHPESSFEDEFGCFKRNHKRARKLF